MNTNENNISKDIFRLLGALIVAIFSIAFGLLRLLGSSENSEDTLAAQSNNFDDHSSISLDSTINPMNSNNIYDD